MYSDVVKPGIVVFSTVSITTRAIWMISWLSGSRPVHSKSTTHQYLAFVGLYVTNRQSPSRRISLHYNFYVSVISFYHVLTMPHQESKHLTSGSHRGWVPSDGGAVFTGPDGSPNLGTGFFSVNIELSLELWSGIAGVSRFDWAFTHTIRTSPCLCSSLEGMRSGHRERNCRRPKRPKVIL